jgi:catechol 2,3-dioxygenase-like lactoylglutathione lyase family enzyme
MFDHVKFGVSDYEASKAFFAKALEPLGVAIVAEGEPAYGVELASPMSSASLCLFRTEGMPAPLHLAFVAENRRQVDAFHRAALERVARTTVRQACVRSTRRITTRPSSSARTGTTSRRFATRPRRTTGERPTAD